MKNYTPDYYDGFACIAGNCKHSCCIGWDIVPDEQTVRFYQKHPKLWQHIKKDSDNGYHICLTEQNRCPFLNKDGLCDIILTHGEQAISQICTDHPRYVNQFDNHTETGLGLCCEAVCALLVNRKAPIVLPTPPDDTLNLREQAFYILRNELVALAQDRSLPVLTRLQNILDRCGISLPQKSDAEWIAFYKSLARLDAAWDTVLDTLRMTDFSLSDTIAEHLTVYFLHRHMAGGLEDGRYLERIAFCVLSVRIAGALSGMEPSEIMRMYSAEIEYAPDNTEILLNLLKQ